MMLLLKLMSKKSSKRREKRTNKGRHFVLKSNSCDAPTLSLSTASIDMLPEAVLQYCFSFVGPGHFRTVAGTNRHFQNVLYLNEHDCDNKTYWARAVESISCAELCLEDARQTTKLDLNDALENISLAASSTGRVKVLEWALDKKGYAFPSECFVRAAANGHVCVLEWAKEKNVEWYSKDMVKSAGRELPERTSWEAAKKGQIGVLDWMKRHDMLDTGDMLWQYASYQGHIHVLDWLWEHDYNVGPNIFLNACKGGHKHVLLWFRQHNIPWSKYICLYAAYFGNLDLLKWLREENNCAWNQRVIVCARNRGFVDIEEYAIENGCPLPEDNDFQFS